MLPGNRFAWLFLPFCLLACSESSPAGRYELDVDATLARVEQRFTEQKAKLSEEDRMHIEMVLPQMLEMTRSMTSSVQLGTDQTFVLELTMPAQAEDRVVGTWKLDGDRIQLTGKSEESGREQVLIGSVRGEDLVVEMGGGQQAMTMIYRRAKP